MQPQRDLGLEMSLACFRNSGTRSLELTKPMHVVYRHQPTQR